VFFILLLFEKYICDTVRSKDYGDVRRMQKSNGQARRFTTMRRYILQKRTPKTGCARGGTNAQSFPVAVEIVLLCFWTASTCHAELKEAVDSEGFWRWCITHRITIFFLTFASSGILETRKHTNYIFFLFPYNSTTHTNHTFLPL
jgi:hypothetical protein